MTQQANPITWNDQSQSVTFSTSSQTKPITGASNAQGNVTYSITSQQTSSGTTVSGFSISGTTLTIPENMNAGEYKIKIKAEAAGNDSYLSGSVEKTVTLTINKAII